MKKFVVLLISVIIISFSFVGCSLFNNEIKDTVSFIEENDEIEKIETHNNFYNGEYHCLGKGGTCKNTTDNAFDYYCDSCDPDRDNMEG